MGSCQSLNNLERLESAEKEEGQRLLRKMTEGDVLDWESIISTAQVLHAKEQGLHVKKQTILKKKRVTKLSNWAARRARRKADIVGSFNVNIGRHDDFDPIGPGASFAFPSQYLWNEDNSVTRSASRTSTTISSKKIGAGSTTSSRQRITWDRSISTPE